jgi:hypothetical protein
MPAGLYNTTIEQGARWQRVLTWRNEEGFLVDLTNWTAAATFRSDIKATDAIIELTSSPAAGITLGGAAGTITMEMLTAETAAFDAEDRGSWDLLMTDSSDESERLVEGTFIITPAVTR